MAWSRSKKRRQRRRRKEARAYRAFLQRTEQEILHPRPSEGQTLYVGFGGNDTNDGASFETRKLTLTEAEKLAKPGDTIYVGAGTYQTKLIAPGRRKAS